MTLPNVLRPMSCAPRPVSYVLHPMPYILRPTFCCQFSSMLIVKLLKTFTVGPGSHLTQSFNFKNSVYPRKYW